MYWQLMLDNSFLDRHTEYNKIRVLLHFSILSQNYSCFDMPLLALPNELLLAVARWLDLERDINALARTNRRLYLLLNSHLYRYNVQHSNSSALLWAAEYKQTKTAQKLVWEHACIQTRNSHDETPLFIAARNGDEEMIELLLQCGADLESKNNFGITALSYATRHGAPVKFLLEKGADPLARDNYGRTPLIYAGCWGTEAAMKFILHHRADIESKDIDGWTALAYAARWGRETTVQLLLRHGADPESRDNDGRVALLHAARWGMDIVVGLLLTHGCDIESKDDEGWTALTHAARWGKEAVVKLLLHHGADPESRDNGGATPFSHASAHGNREIASLLLEMN
ncbi:hypothetical protein EIK77_005134 [Talaromyces pinophilus]|nr:hypothetical protein EIK77_005134 [Talaromyces pinophilus]